MRNLKRMAAFLTALTLCLGLSAAALAAVEDTGFADVDADAWYAEAVEYVRDHGIMNGTSAAIFDPDGTTTRGQITAILYRASGSPEVSGGAAFTDVADGAYYADAVRWANTYGIVTGYGDGTFRPDIPITRQQMAAILWRYAGSPSPEGGADYADEASIASYADTAVDWARDTGIISGRDGNRFDPSGRATRAQAAVILYRYDTWEPPIPEIPAPEPTPEPAPEEGTDVLVAYFSATGTTRPLAEYAAEILNADLYEIVPAEPYTAEDLDYGNSDSRTTREQNDPDARPAISGAVENMEQYDTVLLGYPIWHGQAPRIISTFLESYDFTGKTIVPFCTSHSSGIGSSASALESLTSGAQWVDGQRFPGSASQDTVAQWVDGLGLELSAPAENAPVEAPEDTAMEVRMTVDGQEVTITLLDNATARSLWEQLPLTLEFEDYNSTEKIAYPPEDLSQEGAPASYDPNAGDVTVYGPWGNITIFYEDYGNSVGLIPVGHIDTGLELLSGQDENFTATLEQAA